MAMRRTSRPRDLIRLGKLTVDIATGQVSDALFSKRVENYAHSVAIHTTDYNFVRIHQTLRYTPTMTAGVSAILWELADMVKVLEAREVAQ